MKNFRLTGIENSTWTVSGPRTLKAWFDGEQFPADEYAEVCANGLCKNSSKLEWYKGENAPCLAGCDILIAVDRDEERVWVIFDQFISDVCDFDADKTDDEMLKAACLYG